MSGHSQHGLVGIKHRANPTSCICPRGVGGQPGHGRGSLFLAHPQGLDLGEVQQCPFAMGYRAKPSMPEQGQGQQGRLGRAQQ